MYALFAEICYDTFMRALYDLLIGYISEKFDIAPIVPQIILLIIIGILYNSLAPGGLGLHRGYSGLILYLGISFIVILASILINGKNWLRKPSKQK